MHSMFKYACKGIIIFKSVLWDLWEQIFEVQMNVRGISKRLQWPVEEKYMFFFIGCAIHGYQKSGAVRE